MKTMKAWRWYDFGDMRLDEIPVPELKPGWVIAKTKVVQPSVTEAIRALGLPTLGVKTIRKLIAERAPIQLFGHEFCAEVVEVGDGVKGLKAGDRVAASSYVPCQECPLCLTGQQHRCRRGPVIGRHLPGAFAEYLALPAETLVKIPQGVDDHEGAIVQPLSGAVTAVATAKIEMGDTVAVFGQGVMGLYCAQVAKVSGARRVIGVDVREETLSIAKKLGVDVTINAKNEDPVSSILDITNGSGVEVAFECAGGSAEQGLAGSSTLIQTIEVMRDYGKIVQVALFGQPVELDTDVFRQKSLVYLFPEAPGRLAYTVDLLASKRVSVKPTITHLLEGLEKTPEAFEITSNKASYQAINPAQVVISR